MIHSYPWYPSDWRSSEAVLAMTVEERGIYRELLDHCWETGSVPNDEVVLQKIAMASDREWKRSWPKVKAQFHEREGRLYHVKVDERRPDLEQWHNSRRAAGKKGADKRWGKSPNATSDSSAIATSKPSSSASSTTSPQKRSALRNSPEAECWPNTAAAVRGYFPGSDDALVVLIAQNCARSYADVVSGEQECPPLTDDVIAKAVHEAYFAKQTSAGLFIEKVPRVLKSWAEEAIRDKQIH